MKPIQQLFRQVVTKFSDFAANNQFLMLTLIVIFVGAIWRVWGLSSFSGFSAEELSYLAEAKKLVANGWVPEASQIPQILYTYKVAAVGMVFGYTPLVMRLLASILGITAMVFFFLFVRTWFNKQVALISTLLMATNASMLILSSVVNPMMLILSLQMAVLYIATIAFRDKNIWLFLASAILVCLGLFLSPLFIVTGILLFFASVTMVAKNPKVFKVYKYELLALLLPVLVALGVYGYMVLPESGEIISSLLPGSIADFYLNVGRNILTVFSGSQYVSTLSVASEPIVDPFVAVSSICGIIYAFFHSGKRKHQFVLLWLLFSVIIISMLAEQSVVSLALLLPPLFIVSGIMLDYLLTSWVRTFPYNRSARVVMTVLFSIFLFLAIYYNFQKYFYAWQNNPKVKVEYTKTLAK